MGVWVCAGERGHAQVSGYQHMHTCLLRQHVATGTAAGDAT